MASALHKIFNHPLRLLLFMALLLTPATSGTAAAPEPAFLVKSNIAFGGNNPQGLTAVGNSLYFYVNNALWQSDGTTTGTIPVTIPGMTQPQVPYQLGESLIFFETTGGPVTFISSMVAYNPTTNTATPLKSSFTLLPVFSGAALGQIGDTLFFMVGGSTSEVWKTNGTVSGTVKVATVNPLAGNGFPSRSATVGHMVFFVTDDGVHGYDLWKTDGTSAGTGLVKDIAPAGDFGAVPGNLTPVGSKVLFTASDGVTGRELWVSDGTTAGTTQVKDVTPGSASTFDSNASIRSLATAGGYAYFFISTGFGSYKDLWKSDGSPAGTKLVKEMTLATFGSDPNLTGAGSYVFFANSDAQTGLEPWVSDGTANGTQLLKDIIPGSTGSEPLEFTNIDGTLVFAASSPGISKEVWHSRGSGLTTALLADVEVGFDSSNPQSFTAAGDFVFFTATTTGNALSRELWAIPRSLVRPFNASLPFVVAP